MVVSCTELKEDLSSLLDGELEQHRQTVLVEHLSACAGCRTEQNRFKSLGLLLRKGTAETQEKAPDIWSSLSVKLPGTCECVQDDLSAYLDGELIAPAKEGVTKHLEECSVCLSKFQELSSVTSLLSKGLVLPTNLEVDIWAGVKARLNEDCLLIKTELSAFIDREVNTLRHRAITAHLTECDDCTHEFNELSQTGDVLRSMYQPANADSIDLWPAIQARMNVLPFEAKEKKRAPLAVRRLYAVAAAAVLGVAAASGIIWYSHMNQPQVAPVTAEAYLIDQSLGDPSDVAEAVVYDHTP
jgi:anti-sigma factor RsiW